MSKVSVLIAVYNGKKTIEKTITSYIKQSHQNKELIIIDGGSTDGTQDILRCYNDHITYWESEKDRGIYHAWNKALLHASGEWICFIGADDYWAYDEAINDLVSAGTQENVELVSGKVAIYNARNQLQREWGKPWNWNNIKRYHCIAHPGMMHRRSCFERTGLYNEIYRIAGDYEFSLRLGKFTKATYLDKVFVCMGGSGVSRSEVNKTLLEVFNIQAGHPEIGPLQASKNYLFSQVIIGLKKYFDAL